MPVRRSYIDRFQIALHRPIGWVFVDVDADGGQPTWLISAADRLEIRQLLAAGRAPGRPSIE
nr:hypothetical protein [Nitrosococcus oceani]